MTDLRDQLADALTAMWEAEAGGPLDDLDVFAETRDAYVDALLPLIAAHVEAAAIARAAEELRALARKALNETPGFEPVLIPVADVYARTDALGQP